MFSLCLYHNRYYGVVRRLSRSATALGPSQQLITTTFVADRFHHPGAAEPIVVDPRSGLVAARSNVEIFHPVGVQIADYCLAIGRICPPYRSSST